jgi:hypothetical protein
MRDALGGRENDIYEQLLTGFPPPRAHRAKEAWRVFDRRKRKIHLEMKGGISLGGGMEGSFIRELVSFFRFFLRLVLRAFSEWV